MGGSTTGACQLDSGACDAARRVSEANHPPLTAIIQRRAFTQVRAFFFYILQAWGGMRIPDGGSTTGACQLDSGACDAARRVSEVTKRQDSRFAWLQATRRARHRDVPSDINPPSPPSFREEPVRKYGLFSFIFSRRGGMRIPDWGFDNWRMPVGQRSLRRCPQGERSDKTAG